MLSVERGAVRTASCAIGLALVLRSAVALAQVPPPATSSTGPSRVLLFAKDPPDPLVRRLTAELHSLGFDVLTVPDDENPKSAPQMEAVAQASDAIAAVRISEGDTSIDLWIVNTHTHEMLLRRVVYGKDPAVTALRSVEALRVSLVDLQALVPAAPPPPAPEPEPSKPPEIHEAITLPPPLPPPRRATWDFDLGVGAASATSEFGTSVNARAAVEWMPVRHWGVHVVGVAPFSSAKLSGGEGTAHVTFGLLGAGVSWQPVTANGWTPYAGAGIAGLLLYTRGTPVPGFVGYSQVDLLAAPYLRVGSAVAVNTVWRLTGDLMAAAAVPEPAVFFLDRKQGTWGRPLLVATAGIELAVP
jgi:hypothetical protein